MSNSPTPDHPDPASDHVHGSSGADLACRILADAYHHLVHALRLALPPPPAAGGGNAPEAMLRRDHAAIARIAALAPANAAEADVAAQFVIASEQQKHCLRLADAADASPQWAAKCRAQAAAMMRQADSALRLVLRMQAVRRKLEADTVARDRAAWTEHCALRLMAEALTQLPAPAAEPAAPAKPSEPAPPPGPVAADPADPLGPAMIAAAERYAALYPERAAQIRRTGRLPSDVRYFDPHEASLARALIAGRTPALIALETVPPPKAAQA